MINIIKIFAVILISLFISFNTTINATINASINATPSTSKQINETPAQNTSQESSQESSQDSPQKLTNNTNQEDKKDETHEYKATFIELGSVRCIPCKKMLPIIEEIKKEYKGQVKVVFHDIWTDEGKPFSEKYKVKMIPTQVFLDKNGKEYFRHVGFLPKKKLVEILKQQDVK